MEEELLNWLQLQSITQHKDAKIDLVFIIEFE